MKHQLQTIRAALAVLEAIGENDMYAEEWQKTKQALTALDQLEAMAGEQEPVAWVECDGELVWNNREAAIGRNLYTAAPVAQQPQARPDFADEWTGYLKDGETPFERFLRERKDVQSVLKLYQRALEENERLKAQQPQAEDYKGWYCAHCQRGVDGSEVTFHEQHTVCGRVITDDRPPKQPQAEAYNKTELNFFVQDLYDRGMEEGKRGHYETLFHCVHQAIKRVGGKSSPAWEHHARKLTQWLHCMSYNDSYFGEPAGLVKQVTGELNRLIGAAPQQAEAVPTIYVSCKQLENLKPDPEGTAGTYLPVRKTPRGKFTHPLFAAPQQAEAVPSSCLIDPGSVVSFAVDRWLAEVANRPLVNVNRRTLDDTWRQVIRHFGGDPDALLGPSHDELAAIAQQKGQKP